MILDVGQFASGHIWASYNFTTASMIMDLIAILFVINNIVLTYAWFADL